MGGLTITVDQTVIPCCHSRPKGSKTIMAPPVKLVWNVLGITHRQKMIREWTWRDRQQGCGWCMFVWVCMRWGVADRMSERKEGTAMKGRFVFCI